jgi:hypothetical protein
MSQPAILCPSWNCEEGATLLGIVLSDGRVAFAKDRIVIDAAFVEAAQEGRSPEKRFRFSSTCKKGGCVQWSGDRCGVIDRVLERDPVHVTGALPQCTIRVNCRWHLQSGDEACYACPGVMTDERPENVEELAVATM